MLNYNEEGDLYHEISDFFRPIEPNKTTSIRKKDVLTIVLVKKQQENWSSLIKNNHADVPVPSSYQEYQSSTSPNKRNQIEHSENNIGARNISPGISSNQTDKRPAARTSIAKGSRSPKSISEYSEKEGIITPRQHLNRDDPPKVKDPFFEEISKDFKDLQKSQEKMNFMSSNSPNKLTSPFRGRKDSESDSDCTDEIRNSF